MKHVEMDQKGKEEEGGNWLAYHSFSIAFLSLFGGNGSFPNICRQERLQVQRLRQQSVLLPRHICCLVGTQLLQDLLSWLFALQCLKSLQGNPGDVKQSCSFPVKTCKHEQIWCLSGEHQSQVTLCPVQHPIATGGSKCERVLVYIAAVKRHTAWGHCMCWLSFHTLNPSPALSGCLEPDCSNLLFDLKCPSVLLFLRHHTPCIPAVAHPALLTWCRFCPPGE